MNPLAPQFIVKTAYGAAVSAAAALMLAGCANNGTPMALESGPSGTILALSSDAETPLPTVELKETGFNFEVKASASRGISFGTAVGGSAKSENNEQRPFVPASITKVVTAALVLKHFGGDERFQTEVVWNDGAAGAARDVIIFADGDPLADHGARLKEIADGFRSRGIQKLTGSLRLIANDPRRDQANPPEGLDHEDVLNCYGARVQAFNINRNCANIEVSAVDSARWNASGIATPLRLELTQGRERRVKIAPVFDLVHSVISYSITGTWSKTAGPWRAGVPVADAKGWYGDTLLKVLKASRIDVGELTPLRVEESNAVYLRSDRSSYTNRFSVYSASFERLLALMNKPSDNFLADAFFRAFAVKGTDADLRKAGVEIIERGVSEWMERAGHPEYASEIHLVDGAGLSRDNRVSPRAFVTLLKEFSHEPTFPALWNSLAIAGKDGTLAGRMVGTEAQDFVRGKTGTLRGAYQLVGYLPRGENDYVPFVILSEANPSNRGAVRDFQNRVVAKLASVVKAQRK